MTDGDVARVNAAGALDFAVESATSDRIVVIGLWADCRLSIDSRVVGEGSYARALGAS
jgi:hypothetical protein